MPAFGGTVLGGCAGHERGVSCDGGPWVAPRCQDEAQAASAEDRGSHEQGRIQLEAGAGGHERQAQGDAGHRDPLVEVRSSAEGGLSVLAEAPEVGQPVPSQRRLSRWRGQLCEACS